MHVFIHLLTITLAGCFIVEKHLSRFVEGQDPRDIELMWDQMFRATINYGRKGLTLQAISAVDLALWDLLGENCSINLVYVIDQSYTSIAFKPCKLDLEIG